MALFHFSSRRQDRGPAGGSEPADGDVTCQIRFDGEPVTDPAFALPLPADYIADSAAELRLAA